MRLANFFYVRKDVLRPEICCLSADGPHYHSSLLSIDLWTFVDLETAISKIYIYIYMGEKWLLFKWVKIGEQSEDYKA